ncbi:MAG: polysaccharide biosynthesis tyrosine autokinase, partial [Nocardioidaceae bacterium]
KIFITSPTIATNPLFQQVYQQYTSLEASREVMLAGGAAPTNPDLVVISSKIPGMGPKMIDAVQTQLQSIDASSDALNRRLSAGQSMISISPAIPSVDAERRNQQAQSARKLAGQLQDELQRTKLAEAVEAGQVEIVQLARNPGSRLKSGKNRQLAIGILVGLLFGFGAAVVVDSLDVSIRKRSDIERTLGIPGLAVIPRLPSAGRAGFQAANVLPGLKPKSRGLVTLGDQDLVTVNDIRSSAAESFRTLRTNLMYSQAVQKMRTLLITSASPAEGKTTTAANLAVSFAQQGIRVLLLDCDLRRGRIHRMFGVPREPGLTDLVVGQQEESVVTRSTAVPGLYLVASGKIPPNPAELLGSEGMRKTLARLTEGYDLILVDSPPLLAASDAAILATMVDGVILVLRAGGTEKAAAQQAVDQLNSLGARVVGAVLNDPNSQVAKYGAYYNYQYDNADAVVGS